MGRREPSCVEEGQLSIATHLDQIGYHTIHHNLDTNENYLPHTRQREYIVCIDRTSMLADTNWAAMGQSGGAPCRLGLGILEE